MCCSGCENMLREKYVESHLGKLYNILLSKFDVNLCWKYNFLKVVSVCLLKCYFITNKPMCSSKHNFSGWRDQELLLRVIVNLIYL